MQKIKQKIKWVRGWLSKKTRAYMATRPHRSFRKSRPQRKVREIAGIKQNIFGTFKLIWQEKRMLLGLGLIYVVATYILVGGIAQADFVELKNATLEVFGGTFSSATTAITLLTSTMTGAFNGSLSDLQQFLSVFIGVLLWLTIVWALRMRFADQPIKMRDALYGAGAPIVPYTLVLAAITAQLVPGAIGLFIFNMAQNGGWLQGGVEVMMFAIAALLLCCLSAYWVAGSLVALVVVTLPQMYPWRALSIASGLVVGRRLRMIGHALALIFTIFVLWLVILLPMLLLDGWLHFDPLPLIPIIVQLLGALSVIYASTYVYKLYRSMI